MSTLSRLISFFLLCCFPVGAMAQETGGPVQVGVGVVCDTAQQLERFIALNINDGSAPDVAVNVINTEAESDHARRSPGRPAQSAAAPTVG